MPGATFLEGETVELATMEREDAAALARILNDPRVREGTFRVEPSSHHEEVERIEEFGADEVVLAIAVDGEFVGVVALLDVDDRRGTAELGYQLEPAAWGNGYATDAAHATTRYAFEERGLAKLQARVVAPNEASQRVLEKVGFEREGTFREQDVRGRERVDVYWYGLLSHEWEGR